MRGFGRYTANYTPYERWHARISDLKCAVVEFAAFVDLVSAIPTSNSRFARQKGAILSVYVISYVVPKYSQPHREEKELIASAHDREW